MFCDVYLQDEENQFTIGIVAFQSVLISAGLELVLSHTRKLCIASYKRQFSTNIKKIEKSY